MQGFGKDSAAHPEGVTKERCQLPALLLASSLLRKDLTGKFSPVSQFTLSAIKIFFSDSRFFTIAMTLSL